MTSRLTLFSKVLGFRDGLKLYLHFKSNKKTAIRLSFLRYPFYSRGIFSDKKMFEQIFIHKEYDVAMPFEPTSIIDLGANVGYASIFFANRFPNAKIFAVEPDEQNYLIAKKNLDPYKNVQLVQGAVWHQSQLINLVDKGLGEAGYIVEEGMGKNQVKAYTIKEIMDIMNITEIDVLKMDVEGTEKELFESGYPEWLPATKIVIAETHDRYKAGCSHALFNAVSKYQFSLELSGENLVLYNDEKVKAYTRP